MRAQLLDGSATSVLETVRRLGFLQVDPISTVAPPQQLVLFSRLGPYDRGELDRLLWDEKRLIADVDRARGLRWQVTRKPNPFVGYSASEVGNEGRAGQQGVYFSQEIVTANKLGLNDQVAGWEIEHISGEEVQPVFESRQISTHILTPMGQPTLAGTFNRPPETGAGGAGKDEEPIDVGQTTQFDFADPGDRL